MMMNRKQLIGLIVQKDELDKKVGELRAQYHSIGKEIQNHLEEQNNIIEETKKYMESCVGKCFSCLDEDDDLLWIYKDSEFGLTELRVRKDGHLIRQRRIDHNIAEAFIKSGMPERKGGNNKAFFKHLLYETFQKIEEEAGLNEE